MRTTTLLLLLLTAFSRTKAQEPSVILNQLRTKLETVNDYEADADFKTEISFLKVPDARVKIFYKKPDKIKIKNEKGISLVPKETINISLYSLVNSNYQVLDAGMATVRGIPVRVIKLLPSDENNQLVLATIFVDTKAMQILKSKTTTRESGTNEIELFYGRFPEKGMPEKIVFTFNTQDFKLPKGVTFDYDDGSAKKKAAPDKASQRGKIEITYLNYSINKGISDSIFK